MKPSVKSKSVQKEEIAGKVSTGICDCCGHHEVGITTDEGQFIPLRPGMKVLILERDPEPQKP